MDRIKKIMPASVIICLAVFFFGRVPKGKSMNLENVPIEHETEFGGCYIKITIDDFLGLGYRFGDSLLEENGIRLIIDLSDTEETVKKDIEALKNTIMN